MAFKIDKDYIIHFFLVCVICFLGYHCYKLYKTTERQMNQIEVIESKQGEFSIIHYEEEIENLSKRNKELYDSLKQYKEQIDYVVQFKYDKEYHSGVVETDTIEENVISEDGTDVKIYEYSNTTDTLSYELMIGSTKRPEWYSLDFKVSDKFTIVNKDFENFNKLDIKSDANGIIDDVTVLKKKEKTSIFNNISVGPSVTMGYNFATKEPEFIVGFSITYDIKDLFKKK